MNGEQATRKDSPIIPSLTESASGESIHAPEGTGSELLTDVFHHRSMNGTRRVTTPIIDALPEEMSVRTIRAPPDGGRCAKDTPSPGPLFPRVFVLNTAWASKTQPLSRRSSAGEVKGGSGSNRRRGRGAPHGHDGG